MRIDKFSAHVLLYVLAVGILSACGVSSGNKWPENIQILDSVALTIDAANTFFISIPVINAGKQSSPGAALQLDIAYRTDANGASLTCTYASSNEPKPCATPVRCSHSLTFQVSPLQIEEEWKSPPTAINQTPGDCACRSGHCDGSAILGLSVLGNPPQPAGTLSNTSLRFSWNVSGQGYVDGFVTTDHER